MEVYLNENIEITDNQAILANDNNIERIPDNESILANEDISDYISIVESPVNLYKT